MTVGSRKYRHRKRQQLSNNASSFPRKRESSLPFPQEKHRKVLRAPPLDSRFRGNDEVLSAGYCLSPRRIFDVPAVICERRPISSHARKRESRAAVRKTLRCFSCGNGRLDSRFRGNDGVLPAGYCLPLRRIFGVPTVICERRPISSHARKRESRTAVRKTLQCFSCGGGRLDSRFRACEEIGSVRDVVVIRWVLGPGEGGFDVGW